MAKMITLNPAVTVALDSVVGQHREKGWEGTAGELLAELEKTAGDAVKQKAWPKNGRSLSNALRRLAPMLRAVGIVVEHQREAHAGRRTIHLGAQSGTASTERVQGMI